MIVAVLATLGILGFNLTTVLAGLGIGGIAIAFAAQKTLENLFGGISVLADEVIRVGDYLPLRRSRRDRRRHQPALHPHSHRSNAPSFPSPTARSPP